MLGRRWVTCAMVAVVGLAPACSDPMRLSPSASSSTPSVSTPSAADVIAATTSAGDVRVSLRVKVEIPGDVGGGEGSRTFTGRGFIDRDKDLAGVNFKVASVPDAAGYLGEVGPALSVYYDGSRFFLSFPRLAEELPGKLDWLSYELSALSDPEAVELGIGRLREVGLSDPRLATALLAGAEAELHPGGPLVEEAEGSQPYTVPVDLDKAAAEGPAHLAPVLRELLELGVTSVDVALALDGGDRPTVVSYSLSYAGEEGAQPVRLAVTMDFDKYGLDGGLNPPPARSIAGFEDHVSL